VTTLPVVSPKNVLLRLGSPCIVFRDGDIYREAYGPNTTGDYIWLDLQASLGFYSALLYLADSVAGNSTSGLRFYHKERCDFDHGQYIPAHWVLDGYNWRWVFTEEAAASATYFFIGMHVAGVFKRHCDAAMGFTTVPGILEESDRLKALQKAVLATAEIRRRENE
jgi:hypothetical protein